MAEIIIIISVISIVLLTLLQPVTARILQSDETILIFDIIFIKLILYPNRNRSSVKRKRKARDRLSVRIKRVLLTRRVLEYIIKRSDITIDKVNISLTFTDPVSAIAKLGTISATWGVIIAYLQAHAKTLYYSEDRSILASGVTTKGTSFDITFRFMLFELITALMFYRREFSKIKKVR